MSKCFFPLIFFFCSALYISLIVDVYEEGGRLLLFFFNRFLIRNSLHGTSPSSWYMAKQLETTVIFVVEIRIWAVCLWKEKKKKTLVLVWLNACGLDLTLLQKCTCPLSQTFYYAQLNLIFFFVGIDISKTTE